MEDDDGFVDHHSSDEDDDKVLHRVLQLVEL